MLHSHNNAAMDDYFNQSLINQQRAVLLPWWAVQTLAWSVYCVVSFLSLTLWYGDPQWMHVVQILAEALTGALLTYPFAVALKFIGKGPLPRWIILHLALVPTIALIWNILRMSLFEKLFPGAYIWGEFGGWYFASILIFALWAALYYSMKAYSEVEAEQERARAEHLLRITAESLSRDAKLQMLRYQINPHFIFNTMSSINALVATGRSQEARRMIDHFSDFLRITLDSDDRLFVPLGEEIETVTRYLAVEKMRFNERLRIDIDIHPNVADIMVPSLILQPLVENAVRHGVEAQRSACTIAIRAEASDLRLHIIIEDDGPGLNPQTDSKRKDGGLGLSNVRARLMTVYEDDFTFDLSNRMPQGVLAEIGIPLQPRDQSQ
jgi:two-component system, LytTR family, sensor kinase